MLIEERTTDDPELATLLDDAFAELAHRLDVAGSALNSASGFLYSGA